ncbi:MAG: hypothetical protein K6U78_18940 [Anaerolineae bacterium]|nr:hypothetical protein [Anaerolineae bacterium]
MRDPIIRFSLVVLLSPLCAIVGQALFDEPGLRIGWLLALCLISGFGLWSTRQIWKERSALPRWERFLSLQARGMIAIGTLSGLATLIALILLVRWLADVF